VPTTCACAVPTTCACAVPTTCACAVPTTCACAVLAGRTATVHAFYIFLLTPQRGLTYWSFVTRPQDHHGYLDIALENISNKNEQWYNVMKYKRMNGVIVYR
jgi:hypothetical protein